MKTLYTLRTSDHGYQTPSKDEQGGNAEVNGEEEVDGKREEDEDLGNTIFNVFANVLASAFRTSIMTDHRSTYLF